MKFYEFFSKPRVEYEDEDQSQTPFDNLPNETVSNITSWLDFKNAAQLAATCERMKNNVNKTIISSEYGTYEQIVQKIKNLRKLYENFQPSFFLKFLNQFNSIEGVLLLDLGAAALLNKYACSDRSSFTCQASMASVPLVIFPTIGFFVYYGKVLAKQQTQVDGIQNELNNVTKNIKTKRKKLR